MKRNLRLQAFKEHSLIFFQSTPGTALFVPFSGFSLASQPSPDRSSELEEATPPRSREHQGRQRFQRSKYARLSPLELAVS